MNTDSVPSDHFFKNSNVFIIAPKWKSTDLTKRTSAKRGKQSQDTSVPQSSSPSTISPEIFETITKEVTEKVTAKEEISNMFNALSKLSSRVRGVLHVHLVPIQISIGITQYKKRSRQQLLINLIR